MYNRQFRNRCYNICTIDTGYSRPDTHDIIQGIYYRLSQEDTYYTSLKFILDSNLYNSYLIYNNKPTRIATIYPTRTFCRKGTMLELSTSSSDLIGYLTFNCGDVESSTYKSVYNKNYTFTNASYVTEDSGAIYPSSATTMINKNCFTRKMRLTLTLNGQRVFGPSTPKTLLLEGDENSQSTFNCVNNKIFRVSYKSGNTSTQKMWVSSNNGSTWTESNITNYTTAPRNKEITYYNGKYFMPINFFGTSDDYAGICYSSDGITWNYVAINDSSSTYIINLSPIIWTGTYYVTISTLTNRLWYSTNGINWTKVYFKTPSGNTSLDKNTYSYSGIASNGSGQVIITAHKPNGSSGGTDASNTRTIYLLYSSTPQKASSWSSYTIGTMSTSDGYNHLKYINNKYIYTAGLYCAYASPSSITSWTCQTMIYNAQKNSPSGFSEVLNNMIYLNPYYITGTYLTQGELLFSTDLKNWYPLNNPSYAKAELIPHKINDYSFDIYYAETSYKNGNSVDSVYRQIVNIQDLKQPEMLTNIQEILEFEPNLTAYRSTVKLTTDDLEITVTPTTLLIKTYYKGYTSDLKNRTYLTSIKAKLERYSCTMEDNIINGNTDTYIPFYYFRDSENTNTFINIKNNCAIRLHDTGNSCVY